MKALSIVLLVFLISLNVQGQVILYNPDANADGAIGSPDLLEFLPANGTSILPMEPSVQGLGTLSEIASSVDAVLQDDALVLDSLSQILLGPDSIDCSVFHPFCENALFELGALQPVLYSDNPTSDSALSLPMPTLTMYGTGQPVITTWEDEANHALLYLDTMLGNEIHYAHDSLVEMDCHLAYGPEGGFHLNLKLKNPMNWEQWLASSPGIATTTPTALSTSLPHLWTEWLFFTPDAGSELTGYGTFSGSNLTISTDSFQGAYAIEVGNGTHSAGLISIDGLVDLTGLVTYQNETWIQGTTIARLSVHLE